MIIKNKLKPHKLMKTFMKSSTVKQNGQRANSTLGYGFDIGVKI